MENACDFDARVVQRVPQELTDEDLRYAAKSLNETNDTKQEAITEIKRWTKNELYTQIDDFLSLRFLRVCKFDLEKTKDRIRNYYKQQSDLPEWYRNKDPFRPKMQELLDLGLFLPLRKPDSQGKLVILVRATVHDPKRHEIPDILKNSILAIETAIKYYPATSIYGCTLLIDVANPTTHHILQIQPYVLMNLVHTWQSCYPMRCQKIVFFNVSTVFNVILGIIRSFMTAKVKSRFYVYSNAIECFEDIPANILPIEYNGTDGTLQELTVYWKKLIEKNRDWVVKNENNNHIDEISEDTEEEFQQTYL
ncbi:retinol-binding protein pinta [Solenopsis invicta]|uniref:retinol-binding protein pinta n=1 Tax=Solenopsis invicta TaxID=13686 RepID=UPI00193EBE68|nr:retinol-binding protein pinta [Solenopsis invicta]